MTISLKTGGSIMLSYKKIQRLLIAVLVIGSITMVFAPVSVAVNVELTNVNSDNYPGIHLYLRATDDEGNYLQDLGNSNFEVRENGVLVDFLVTAEYGYIAVSLVMDQSGSMSGNEQTVIDACSFFVDGLENLDKGAIVKFSNSYYVDVPMTYDKDDLLASIGTYYTSGSTALWSAIALGIEECFYEPEKSAVVAFTDGMNNQWQNFAAQLPGLAGTDISIYTIGIGNQVEPDSLIWVAEETGGFYMHIEEASQMQEVLEDIRQDVESLYDLYYVTPDPSLNGTLRSIQVILDYQGETAWDTISYVAPLSSPPSISLLPETQVMLGESQPANVSIEIECEINASNPIVSSRIYYKTIGETYFNQAELVYYSGNYHYDIPAATMQNPGIVFYLQVTDNMGSTVTLPEFDPGYLPFCISVMPNYAPTFVYNPPESWLTRRSLPIDVLVADLNSNVDEVLLYYRPRGLFFYTEVSMEFIGGSQYHYTIEGPEVDDHFDLEYFIAAWDDQDAVSYWPSSYSQPYMLFVLDELGPTPPAAILEPDELPIIIPATGGQFDYTTVILNPIPDSSECDVWVDLILPDGSVEMIGEIITDLPLEGGGSYTESFTQEVPETAVPGDYFFRLHTGVYDSLEVFYTASFPFTKSATMAGPGGYNNGWAWYPIEPPPAEGGDVVVLFTADKPCLSRGYPNPFNATTSLNFYLPEQDFISLIIYNLEGREVARLFEGNHPAGQYRIDWDARDFSSGIYFCTLITGDAVLTTKLSLIK
ncbi:hypothetical protein CEE37_05650 [candidate division LCP-89 bacterium B3_LCP]|uniref:VWFA domain-containing protein n=1 Tax=candidate division LCP-89 bacterium B3_LCP TaxID=2012998 RepID=A0A532V1Z6_UNCL8|nr:MAG: hypothetical protein CEE37_05650 [candidate division LCP-89 bacterium B3_LCP]